MMDWINADAGELREDREPRQAWDDRAEEGVDYDVVTRSRTFSAQTRVQEMIDELIADHDGAASQPEILSFGITVEAVDTRTVDRAPEIVPTWIVASMDGRRGR